MPESVLLPSFIDDTLARSHLNAAFTLVHLETFAFISLPTALCLRSVYDLFSLSGTDNMSSVKTDLLLNLLLMFLEMKNLLL